MLQERALSRAKAGTGTPIDFSGRWKNQIDSEMRITQAGDQLSGEYESKVSSGGGTTIGDLLGYVDGDLISFVVHWRDYQAITTWVGQLEPKASEQTIKTLWQMVKEVPQEEEWKSINAGSDTFTRV